MAGHPHSLRLYDVRTASTIHMMRDTDMTGVIVQVEYFVLNQKTFVVERKGEPMSDLIDRAAAIDIVRSECRCGEQMDLIRELKALPSAQPEIILCRDCKYWLPHEQFGYDEDNEEYHDYCAKLVPEDEYYAFRRHADEWCSRAERRTDETD